MPATWLHFVHEIHVHCVRGSVQDLIVGTITELRFDGRCTLDSPLSYRLDYVHLYIYTYTCISTWSVVSSPDEDLGKSGDLHTVKLNWADLKESMEAWVRPVTFGQCLFAHLKEVHKGRVHSQEVISLGKGRKEMWTTVTWTKILF